MCVHMCVCMYVCILEEPYAIYVIYKRLQQTQLGGCGAGGIFQIWIEKLNTKKKTCCVWVHILYNWVHLAARG